MPLPHQDTISICITIHHQDRDLLAASLRQSSRRAPALVPSREQAASRWFPILAFLFIYLAALLHDLGLTRRFDDNHPFEIAEANAARTFLLQQGIPAEKAEVVHQAIALHLSLEAEQQRPEIALVHLGAILDVRGHRLEDLPGERLHQILEAYPRLGFKQAFAEAMMEQARKKPASAVAEAIRNGALDGLRQAPFPD
jgi:hypothetical protein